MHKNASHPRAAEPPASQSDTSRGQDPLARLWRDLASCAVAEHRHDGLEHVWALRSVRSAARQLERAVTSEFASDETRRTALAAGALALRACSAAVEPGARAGSPARLDLSQQLEAALEAHETSVLAAQAGYSLSPTLVRSAGKEVVRAFLRLRVGSGSRAEAVAEAEDRTIGLALLCVRAALNVTRFGRAAGPPRAPSESWRRRLASVVDEAQHEAAKLRDAHPRATPSDWWEQALATRPCNTTLLDAVDPALDRNLRAEALLGLRAAWAARAARELLVLEIAPRVATGGPRRHPVRSVAAAASLLLADAQLAERPAAFDHVHAWQADDRRLLRPLRAYVDAAADRTAPAESHPRTLMENLAVATVAIAMLDTQLGTSPHPDPH